MVILERTSNSVQHCLKCTSVHRSYETFSRIIVLEKVSVSHWRSIRCVQALIFANSKTVFGSSPAVDMFLAFQKFPCQLKELPLSLHLCFTHLAPDPAILVCGHAQIGMRSCSFNWIQILFMACFAFGLCPLQH